MAEAPRFQICIFEKYGKCLYKGSVLANGAEVSKFSGVIYCQKGMDNASTCDRAELVENLSVKEEVQGRILPEAQ